MKLYQNRIFKNLLLLLGLSLITVGLNFQILSYNSMYFEQPILYVANHNVDSLRLLFQQYTHPKFLHLAIPFFRPSGHFLVYFILAPLFGWHNTQVFFLVNLLFLALSGYLIIKLYQLLFPGYVIGGYIAFAIYLMHPAMIILRLTIMHFEYANVFFILLSLYCFIKFSKQNYNAEHIHKFGFFFLAMVFWVVSVTFKEVAIMLGPVLLAYFFVVHRNESLGKFIFRAEVLQVTFILILLTMTLFFYIAWPWPSLFHNPIRNSIAPSARLSSVKEFIIFFLGFFTKGDGSLYHQVVNPISVPVVMVLSVLLALCLWVTRIVGGVTQREKKRLLFLAMASLIFVVLPITWAMAMPWHLNLTILFFAFIVGFAIEKVSSLGVLIAIMIALITPFTNAKNIHNINKHFGIVIKANLNAVFHPPLNKAALSSNSIIVVEDTIIGNSYALGASHSPFVANDLGDLSIIQESYQYTDLPYGPSYNGTLFKYAYLMPSLREEEYPFSIEHMDKVPNEILRGWIQESKNIFCFGYDEAGHWHDRTAPFQKQLIAEQQRRHLVVNSYLAISGKRWKGHSVKNLMLEMDDPELCQQYCDSNLSCKSFVMIDTHFRQGIKPQCFVYTEMASEQVNCAACTIFVKTG